MSTYYSFKCDKCKLLGGFMSRQAWGSGNADLVDNFKFVMYHSLECGTDYVGVCDEHSEEYTDYEDTNIQTKARLKHLKDTVNIFPHSSDWEFMRDNQKEFKKKWVASERKKAKENNW